MLTCKQAWVVAVLPRTGFSYGIGFGRLFWTGQFLESCSCDQGIWFISWVINSQNGMPVCLSFFRFFFSPFSGVTTLLMWGQLFQRYTALLCIWHCPFFWPRTTGTSLWELRTIMNVLDSISPYNLGSHGLGNKT
jgi:hypothetical protein